MTVTIRACAKINLTLRLTGRRPDGYHDLRTILQSVALHDTLRFRETRGPFQIEYDGLVIEHPSARLESRSSSLALSWFFPPNRVRVEGKLRNVAIEPTRPGVKLAVNFRTADFTYDARGRRPRLALRGWTSDALTLDGTLRLDQRGRLAEMDLKGDIKPEEWKRLWAGEEEPPAETAWLPYEVTLKEGFFETRLNHKTLLRSRWTMRENRAA